MASLQDAGQKVMEASKINRQEIDAICAGLAGAGDLEIAARMAAGLRELFPGAVVNVCTDLEIALAAVPGEGPAIVLVAGTGSAATGRDAAGNIARAGGLGSKIGDEGSATDIGRQAIAAVRQARATNSQQSLLEKFVLDKFDCVSWEEFEETTRESRDDLFPPIFPAVIEACDAGDLSAREILSRAAMQLASLVRELAASLHLGELRFEVAKTGGMIGRCDFFDTRIDLELRAVAPLAGIGVLPISPAESAARLALASLARSQAGDP